MDNLKKGYYDSGALRYECTLKDGLRNGPFRRYYESGALHLKATFRNDLLEGPEEEYYENGQLRECRVYSLGLVADSTVTVMNEDGSLSETEEWKDGYCRSFGADRKLRSEFKLYNGRYEGTYRAYFENGKVRNTVNFQMGVAQGEACEYGEDGSLVRKSTFADNTLDGEDLFFYPSGKIRNKDTYSDGILVGERFEYHESGAIMWRIPVRGGYADGLGLKYFEDGSIAGEQPFSCGRREGTAKFYDEGEGEGSYTELPFRYDQLDGTVRRYLGGSLFMEIPYKSGLRQGYMQTYNSKGEVVSKMLYIDDQCYGTKWIKHYEDGGMRCECDVNGDLPNGDAVYYHENGTVMAKVQYKTGMPIDGKYDYYDEYGAHSGHIVYTNGKARVFDNSNSLITEWIDFRGSRNGPSCVYDGNATGNTEYFFDDTSCDDEFDFLDTTYTYLARKCAVQFEDRCPEFSEEGFKQFFAASHEAIMQSGASSPSTGKYTELEIPEEGISEEQFPDYIVREFVLRLRLPNDAETEQRIASELRKLVGM